MSVAARLARVSLLPLLAAVVLWLAGCGSYSSGNGGGGGGNTPAAPTGLNAAPGNAQVTLTWTASSGATSYYVKRSTTSGAEVQVATASAATYTDSSLTNGTKYYYVVSAYNSYGQSANSAEVFATPVSASADVAITIDPVVTKPISPYIYGINFYSGISGAPPQLTLDRDGGNRWTAYNWINNASNAGRDYFYENDDYLCNTTCNASLPADSVDLFIAGDHANGMASLVTLQMQGYVAVDTTKVQVPKPFPNLTYFRPVVYKKANAPFTLTPSSATTDKNVYMDEFAWALDQNFSGMNIFGTGATHPTFISLDNEPDLWSSTHEEIQGSTNLSTSNFIAKTVSLSSALKDLKSKFPTQFSNVVIFGPVNYGFGGIYSWQSDLTLRPTPNGADWFADKYLAGIKSASTTYGAPLVDVYDFHWYSEARDPVSNMRVTDMTSSALTDAQVQAIVQSPRSLWDATFTETSWIASTLGGPINILGRLQAKIAAANPGMKLSITEYENGGFNHIAGTIAQADNLGIFSNMGIFAANFWPPGCPNTNPNCYSYTLAGFRAFRGFDGAAANFGDTSIQSTSSDVASVVVYASTDTTAPGRVVLVAINRSNAAKVTAINGQALTGTAHLWQMTGPTAAVQTVVHPVSAGTQPFSGSSMTITLPAYSVTTIDFH